MKLSRLWLSVHRIIRHLSNTIAVVIIVKITGVKESFIVKLYRLWLSVHRIIRHLSNVEKGKYASLIISLE